MLEVLEAYRPPMRVGKGGGTGQGGGIVVSETVRLLRQNECELVQRRGLLLHRG